MMRLWRILFIINLLRNNDKESVPEFWHTLFVYVLK